jgi:HEAT repeat protein
MKTALCFSVVWIAVGAIAPAWSLQPELAKPDPERVRALVKDLDDNRFLVRQRADRNLRALGKEALPLLQTELKATKSEQARVFLKTIIEDTQLEERIRGWIKQLGSVHFRERQNATDQLLQQGKAALPVLKRELERRPDPEIQRRLERIIKTIAP